MGSDEDDIKAYGLLQISIHAPRVGSDFKVHKVSSYFIISIHAPRVGSDLVSAPAVGQERKFQSTLPAWGATSAIGTSAS